jgi:transglutaminase-like putative cysteine protease
VFEHKRGVCQDYAHLTLTCLRSIGLAARYVSGYIETIPPPGQEKLTGADATHAWIALFVPGSGWIDFDPTNNLKPYDQHVTLAIGRDFSDITPLKGIMFGGGNQVLDVSVDMSRG